MDARQADGQVAAQRLRLVASEPAAEAMARLTGKHGPVALVQSVRCAACGEPACYRLAEFTAGSTEVLLGTAAGAEIWLDSRLLQVWHGTLVVLDLERGYSAGPTLPAGDGMHFVIRLVDPDHPDHDRYLD